jgi:hypothetical protein
MSCCCNWGFAISGEWPEFECRDCPLHLRGLGPVDHRCRRHRREAELAAAAAAQLRSDLNDRSDALIADLVALEQELA